MKNIKNISIIVLCAIVLFGFSVWAWVKAPVDYSNSERRALEKFPSISADTLKTGKFMSSFEDYSMDQFPMRDTFRSIRAVALKYVFAQKDNHSIYSVNGYVSKLEYPLSEGKVNVNIDKLNNVYNKFIKDSNCKVYLSVIPDKNRYLAPLGGFLQMDYDELISMICEGVEHDTYIDISNMLVLEDFYYTDQHWRQECITDVADRISQTMLGNTAGIKKSDFTENILDYPFYGAYVGQSGLSFKADEIHYLTNDVLDSCIVTSYATGKAKEAPMYNLAKGQSKDSYELFLSGADPLIVIESPKAATDKELIVFRDSFGSSLIPLLAEQYAKITVVDLRYIKSDYLGKFVSFENQDILFLYSTLIFNNSISM